MKKIKYLFLAMTIFFVTSISLTACASSEIKTDVIEDMVILLQVDNPQMVSNNTIKSIDENQGTVPTVINGRTLVPIRAIIEELGGNVSWQQETQTVILTYKTNEIKLSINSNAAYLNGKEYTLDVAPQIINERTMLPIRFIAEGFNFNVFWDYETSVITITTSTETAGKQIPSEWLKEHNIEAQKLTVHFIDVGQGDSIFIELPNSKTMLIDAGPSAGVVAPYITTMGYSSIDYVIATHPDADHITGMPEILNNFSVGTFYMPEKEHTTKIFESMLNALENNGCNAEYAIAGRQIINNQGLTVCFLGPIRIYGDNNACSAVIKLQYGNTSFLFTGDAEYSAESDMLASGADLTADILKIGHHGSASSTSETFLKAVNPKEAVISVGKNNKYNHPTDKIIGLLNDFNINIYRTDEVGTIVIVSDGENYTIDKLKSTIEINAPPQESIENNDTFTESNQGYSTENNSAVVYKTKTGSKYHNAGCSYLKSSIQTTVSEAKAAGLTPCSRCNPPQ